MFRNVLHVFYFILFSYNVHSANILTILSHPGRSHYMVFEPLLRRLAERGHNMTVASFFPMKNPPANYRDISFKGIAEIRLESLDIANFENENVLYKVPILGSVAKQVIELQPFASASVNICERLTNFQPLSEALESDYDLVIVENFLSDCVLGLLYVYGLKAPVVSLLSGNAMPWTMQRVGAVDNPAYVPVITSRFTSKMSFSDRLENTLLIVALNEWHNKYILVEETKVIEKKFGSIPDLRELGRNVSVMMLNSFYALNGVKPSVPALVEVGGMHLSTEKKPIPKYMERFLNESENGVLLVSFGSHLKTMSLPKYKEQIFVNALSKLKVRVLWKYEGSGEEGTLSSNILRVKWIPQYELLQHEKVIAFMCHGGMLGMIEAVSAGKPMVVVPFFADQHNNAAAASEAGVATVVPYKDLTEDALDNALQAVLSNAMVVKARQVSQMWHDRESPPLETAVFYTERAIRWGHNAQLHSAARDLPFYQLALIDVAITLIIIIVLFLALIVYSIIKLLKGFMKPSKAKVN